MSTDISETTPSEPSANGTQRLRGRALGLTLAALMLTLLLEALDQTVVGTALPKISASLKALICIPGSSRRICSPQRP